MRALPAASSRLQASRRCLVQPQSARCPALQRPMSRTHAHQREPGPIWVPDSAASAHGDQPERQLGSGAGSGAGTVSMRRRSMLFGCCCGWCMGGRAARAAGGGGGGHWGWYDSVIAWAMQNAMSEYTAKITPVKQALFSQLFAALEEGRGAGSSEPLKVLEIGFGTGPNLPYYTQLGPASMQVTGVEPNKAMWQYATQNAAAAGFLMTSVSSSGSGSSDGADASANEAFSSSLPSSRQLALFQDDAEALPFADGSFDAVVCTLVLCSVSDPTAVLLEVARVLRPGARFAFIEHVLSPNPGLTQALQKVLNPLQQAVAGNCHLTRDSLAAIQTAGFGVKGVAVLGGGESGWTDGLGPAGRVQAGEVVRFEVPGLGPLSPHITGIV